MKNRGAKKPAREEWGQRAQAILDRATAETAEAVTPHHEINQRVHDLAHEEWMKWAQAIVDHHSVAPGSDYDGRSDKRNPQTEKPGRGEWIGLAQVVVDRLTTCAHIYSKPPYEDALMPDTERQNKNGKTLDLLRRIHALTDDADTPTDSLTDLEHHDERVIAGLKVLLRETLELLPELSADMQALLKSPWHDHCNGRLANELFRGPLGNEPEGIGSGYPADGRLPEILNELLEREESGNGRSPREALRGPHAHHPRWEDETARRWTEQNSQYLRAAGRVD